MLVLKLSHALFISFVERNKRKETKGENETNVKGRNKGFGNNQSSSPQNKTISQRSSLWLPEVWGLRNTNATEEQVGGGVSPLMKQAAVHFIWCKYHEMFAHNRTPCSETAEYTLLHARWLQSPGEWFLWGARFPFSSEKGGKTGHLAGQRYFKFLAPRPGIQGC